LKTGFMINTHHEFYINGILLVLIGFSFIDLGFQNSNGKSLLFLVLAFLGTFSNGFAFLIAGLLTGEGTELTPSFNALAHHVR